MEVKEEQIESEETKDLPFEPKVVNDEIYEDEKGILKRIWKWNVDDIEEDKETSWLKASFTNLLDKNNYVFAFITKEGKRLNSDFYDYIENFSDGLALVAKKGYGYGYVDKNLNLKIPMKYDYAESFKSGFAQVEYEGKKYFINKKGDEIPLISKNSNLEYEEVLDFYNGISLVSTKKFEKNDFAYKYRYNHLAGLWGVINEFGEEIIQPQYIFANGFRNGIAIVCKGTWKKDKNDKYSVENPIWGGINTDGIEVIPFIFDEIKFFDNTNDVFMAHYGGLEDGHWGIIDHNGNWVAQPVFEDIRYKFFDGLFAFNNEPIKEKYPIKEGSDDEEEDVLYGVYDSNLQKILLEPQFLWVNFLQDGLLQVGVYDEEQDKYIEKIIDRNGKEQFHSVYSLFFELNSNYLSAGIWDEEGNKKFGVIDKKGNVIYPCEEGTGPTNFFNEQNRIRFLTSKGKGIKNFDGEIIVPPIYKDIYYEREPLLGVTGKNGLEGLITPEGKEVIPCDFESIHWLQDDKHILCCRQGFCQMLEYIEK